MKTIILYHPVSDHSSRVESYAKEYASRGYGAVELLSLETKEGSEMAKLYDIVRYPAVLSLRETGELLKNWEEDQLPLMQEVAAYQRS